MPTRRALLGAVALAAPALAQSWPTRPIRMLVGYPPGSPPDLIGRVFGPGMGERLGQPVLVENRPGANTALATEALLRAPADGYTLMMMPQFVPALPAVQRVSGFDVADLQPLAGTGQAPMVLLVPPALGVTDLAGFLALARARGDRLGFAHAGHAGVPNLAMALLAEAAGIRPMGVAFRNTVTPLLSGDVDCAFGFLGDAAPQVRAGKLVGLAVTTRARSPLLPEVPSFAELGIPAVEIAAWFAVTVHRAVPAPLQARLTEAVRQVRAEPEVAGRLEGAGLSIFPLDGAALQDFALRERDRHLLLFERLGVRPD
ncbi:tripartite tricarboxylate transporter substrate binding protein [Paracraurococcus lichenis]|uniref:Tripartite tricarboxylate transporter substrate binding protein n=1 Tax=Paracraurococcus lichenis TaxID=3064888 RepID=A0ABT9DZI8_9PROT|nr:tripartite tricarboxylate transporter substrate binding protein [Paracraurococcus sp. LOR1-02]MDO9709311.1 tripartite tricarboxylate transporter substrate binding protein [Paracraurococcus sp. LOR1-02]